MSLKLHFPAYRAGLLLFLAASVILIGVQAEKKAVLAAPAPELPAELRYVPHDAALFIHLDAAAVWNNSIVRSFRDADKTLAAKFEEEIQSILGQKIADLNTVTLYFPKIKEPKDFQHFGLVFSFKRDFDKKKLQEGVQAVVEKDITVKVEVPSEKLAVVLVGLGEDFARPQAKGAEGPLSEAILAAASGKHVMVGGATFANLPDEVQMDDLPEEVRPFQPILKSHSLYAALGLDKTLTLDVRVNSRREGQAVEAEKALAAFVKLITGQLAPELKELEDDAPIDAAVKDLVKVFKAGLAAAKDAKYSVEGKQARMTMELDLGELPLKNAFTASVRKVKQASDEKRSLNNLKQLALSIHSYHDANNNLPPAAICDKNGKPLLSWRVLILPYIDHEELFKQFKLDEPWDSENNKKLLAKMPSVYRLPGAKDDTTDTHYRVFVGNGAGFDWLIGGTFQTFADGTSNTLMIATGADAVPWTKPEELEYDAKQDPTTLLGLVVHGKAQVAMFDGSVRSLKKLPSKKTLHGLITKAGGEVIGDDFK